MKSILSLLLLASVNLLRAQAPIFQWAKQMGDSLNQYGSAIAMDEQGYIYTTGTFEGTVDFDPGPGVYTLTSNGDRDIYVLKLNPSGNFMWVRRIGGAGADYAVNLVKDRSDNIIITGNFSGTVDFNPESGVFNMTSPGSTFILKLNASGHFLWASQMGGVLVTVVYYVNLDMQENIFISGAFSGTGDFDPGPGIFNLTAVNNSYNNMFVVKLNPSGSFIWAKCFGAMSFGDFGVTTDSQGNVCLAGSFNKITDFDPGPGVYTMTPAGAADAFVVKLDSAGNFIWMKNIGGSNDDFCYSVYSDPNGDVCLCGTFSGTTDLDPGPGVSNFSALGKNDVFIMKLSASGAYCWEKQLLGQTIESTSYITTDVAGNVYCTGAFNKICDFDPGPGTHTINAIFTTNSFILKLDPQGNFMWVENFDSFMFYILRPIALDSKGNIGVTGGFTASVDIDPGLDPYYLNSAGKGDIFVLKLLNPNPIGLTQNNPPNALRIFPNPTNGYLNVLPNAGENDLDLKLLNIGGQTLLEAVNAQALDLSAFPSGIYFLEAISGQSIVRTKVIKD